MSEQNSPAIDRRRFMTVVGLGAGAGAAASLVAGTGAAEAAAGVAAAGGAEAGGDGYRETEHVKTYYKLARM
ncbi:MAG: formate dehydrogenase [Azospirillum sp.]|nr:formate dehydrogenase [Azospirillum sp.]